MFDPASLIGRLTTAPMRPGRVVWLGVRPDRHAPLTSAERIELDPVLGLIGDHYAGRSGSRQVSLIAAEHLAAIASYLGRVAVTPEELRRNVVVAGLNLAALIGSPVRLGSAVILPTGPCAPCSRMEAILGPGGYNAVRGHGGIVARVVTAGRAVLGDAVGRDAGT